MSDGHGGHAASIDAAMDAATVRKRTVHGAAASALTQLIKFVLQFGSQIVLARLLDPEQFGLVAMIWPVLGLVMAFNDFGLGQAIVQRPEITHKQISSVFWISLAISAGLTLVAFLVAPLIALIYGEPRTFWITVASGSLLMVSSLSTVHMALLNRQMRFVALSSVELLSLMFGVVSGIVAAWLGAGYWSLVIVQAANATTSTMMAWFYCRWRPSRPALEPGIGAMMKFGTNILGSNLATYLSMSADNFIVGVTSGKVALGLYDRSYNLVVKPLSQLMAPASRVAIPLLSRLQDQPERYARAYQLMLQLTTVACVPGLIATIVCADTIIALLLGPKWIAMVPIFHWICIGGLASVLSASTYWLFTTQARTGEQARFAITAAVISVAAFGLGSVWGVEGVALVSAIAFVAVQTPLLVWASTRIGPVTLRAVVLGHVPLVLAGSVSAIVCIGIGRSGLSNLWLIAVTFCLSYVVFMATLLAHPMGRSLLRDARSILRPR